MGAKSVLPFKGNLKESSSQSHHGDKNCMTDSDEGWFFCEMQQNVSGLATFSCNKNKVEGFREKAQTVHNVAASPAATARKWPRC